MAIPRSFDELRAVRGTLALYHAQVPARLAALLAAAHIFLQTFLTPGAVGINILAGSLYHPVVALTFITAVSTAGSATNYLMVRWQLKDVLVALFPHRIQTFSAEVKRHRAHLMHYALFLRVTPIFPAWFINVASPIVDIPFSVFIIATAVGHQPHNLITIQARASGGNRTLMRGEDAPCVHYKAGRSLQTMHSLHDLYSLQNVALLLGIGLLALLPRLIRKLQGRRGPLLPISDPAAAGDGDKTPDHDQ
ncbi:putative membrane protein [Auxenochlorella protothecoides]|uniref:Putative membrane protein n=2 Tax=Auxenochlorella protothecoides TaxID=3075 RepID=A0A087SGP2_AUXPR|nr:putative membrane protein [Auxenochlorella protothecoides]KFM24896.1 putative membrane protein [Auxenochlorella protothecoides]